MVKVPPCVHFIFINISRHKKLTSTRCSFTTNEERVLKKFSKWFEFVFLFTLGKNSISIMLCKFLLRLRVWEWLIDFWSSWFPLLVGLPSLLISSSWLARVPWQDSWSGIKISSMVFCPTAALLPVSTLYRLPKNLSTMALDTARQNSSLIKSSIIVLTIWSNRGVEKLVPSYAVTSWRWHKEFNRVVYKVMPFV